MYEDLVKRLRDISNSNSNIKSNYIGLTMIQAADAIEELSKQNEKWEEVVKTALDFIPCWIPVTERLPEKRKWVLCRCEANIIEVLRWENNEWYHDPMHAYYPSFVTHWMPLPPAPEPPKEET